jgi:hypothetical protein
MRIAIFVILAVFSCCCQAAPQPNPQICPKYPCAYRECAAGETPVTPTDSSGCQMCQSCYYAATTSTTCTGGQIWNDCGSACTRTCDNQNPMCTDQCVPRCQCPNDKPIWRNDNCIAATQCAAQCPALGKCQVIKDCRYDLVTETDAKGCKQCAKCPPTAPQADPCKKAHCKAPTSKCELRDVTCKKAPCPKQAVCVAPTTECRMFKCPAVTCTDGAAAVAEKDSNGCQKGCPQCPTPAAPYISPCAAILCPANQKCKVKTNPCLIAPCPEEAYCEPELIVDPPPPQPASTGSVCPELSCLSVSDCPYYTYAKPMPGRDCTYCAQCPEDPCTVNNPCKAPEKCRAIQPQCFTTPCFPVTECYSSSACPTLENCPRPSCVVGYVLSTKVDSNGCNQCPTCVPAPQCSRPLCSTPDPPKCAGGITPITPKDANGCNGCPYCPKKQCEAMMCPMYYPLCTDGATPVTATDSDGCPGCLACPPAKITNPCMTVKCASPKICKVNADGTAGCADPEPVCPPSDPCNIRCSTPLKKDSNGCQLCACEDPAPASSPAPNPCLNYKCPTGQACTSQQVTCVAAPCNPVAKCVVPPTDCPPLCETACKNGNVNDERGCPKCACL